MASAALAVLEIVNDPGLLRGVREIGAELQAGLLSLDGVREVRGRGLMFGVGLEEGIDASALRDDLLQHGLVVNAPEPGTIRLLPPLLIDAEDVRAALEAFGKSLG